MLSYFRFLRRLFQRLSIADAARQLASRGGVVAVVLAVVASMMVLLVMQPRPRMTIGVENRRLVTLPGSPLEAVPFTEGDPLAVRIASIEPQRSGFRYDLRFMAYGPGEFDLRDYLIDSRQQRPQGLPPLKITVTPLLAADESGKLVETPVSGITLYSNYQLGMTLLCCLWGALLFPLLWHGHHSRKRSLPTVPAPTIADRLRQLLEQAAIDEPPVEQQAEIERLLLAYWSERLGVTTERLADTVERLRRHPVASAHVLTLETWLHRPGARADRRIARELLRDLTGQLGH